METSCQKCCTITYVLTWVLLGIGLLLYHVAIVKVVPELKDFPDNLRDGFYAVLGFDNLEAEALSIKTQSTSALALCDQTPPCSDPPAQPNPITKTSTTSTQLASIENSFSSVLDMILKVTSDPYFGVAGMESTASDLQDIKDQIANVGSDANGGLCAVTDIIYCQLYTLADSIYGEVGPVKAEIDKFTNGKEVKEFKDNADYLNILHCLPYVLVVSAIFFLFFWWKFATCCCCKGGGCGGLLLMIAYFLFWLISFIVNTVVLALCIVVKFGQDRLDIEFLNGKPNLEVLIAHLQKEYPVFWDKVFVKMEDGLEFFFKAVATFEVFAIVILVYSLCLCLFRPYTKDESKVVAM